MNKNKKNKSDNLLISDTGVVESGKKEYVTKIFINTCQLLSVILIILGILAFIKGNF
ncbi:hypothetical protein [Butyrivibrio sp. VCD2006]|uniref:hypothetical protein n=1 Tax=Butyrivibrio sp. VCD2006 TaxID=1280664 RepID=UPI0004244DCA|nr:hypothetical protein [Butyrivibrio sp. VCD2006]